MRYSFIAGISMAGQLTSLGLAFLFHFIMARWLGVAAYGDLGILLGTFTLLFYPAISVQAVLMREVAVLHTQNKAANISWLLTRYFRQSVIVTLPFLALALLVLHLLGLLVEPVAMLLVLLSIPLFYAVFVFNSYFQGTQQPLQFASVPVSIDFLRLVFALLLVSAGFELVGVGLAYLLPAVLLFAIAFFWFRSQPRGKPFSFSLLQHVRWVLPTYALLSLFLFIDLFFVRSLLGAEDAGIYNAALVLARAVFYASLGLMAAFLPQSSKLVQKSDSPRIFRYFGLSVLLLSLLALLLFLFKAPLVEFLYGTLYTPSSGLLGILAFSMLFLATAFLLINFLWSRKEQRLPFYITLLVALLALPIFYFFTMTYGIVGTAYASVCSTALLALLSAAAVWSKL